MTETLERSYYDSNGREIVIDGDYESNMVVFDRTVGELHHALVETEFVVRRILEPGSDDPDDYDDCPPASTQQELPAKVPRNLRFLAVTQ